MDDSSEALEHSWGASPKAKAREKEYNHWYYQKHKDEIAAIRKQRHAATNSYKQAEKSYNDARRYEALAGTMRARTSGYKVGNVYKDPDGNYRGKVTPAYSGRLNDQARDRLNNAERKYEKMAYESSRRGDILISSGAWQNAKAKDEAKKILRGLKNPTAKDLAEFYMDTTVEKAKKSAGKVANKAKKFAVKSATKAIPTTEKAANKAKKYATKAVSNAEKAAEKYATKAIPTIEKASNKAKKYATKTVKSAANKAKKYAVR